MMTYNVNDALELPAAALARPGSENALQSAATAALLKAPPVLDCHAAWRPPWLLRTTPHAVGLLLRAPPVGLIRRAERAGEEQPLRTCRG